MLREQVIGGAAKLMINRAAELDQSLLQLTFSIHRSISSSSIAR